TVSRLTRNDSFPFTIYACHASDEKVPEKDVALSGANLKMKEVTIQENGGDNIWVSLGIDYYQPDVLPENWNPEEFDSAIEFWEIDPDYDEKLFNSRYQIFSPHHQKTSMLPLNILLSLPHRKTYKIAVKVHDSFAGQQMQVLHFSLPDSAQK
ncbi:MAG: hypothetical protein H6Q64_457, partial [Firmicutes bacterium]|nr:hypothetical protein [Bacillota bacterium]